VSDRKADEERPFLQLHFDVNKTLVICDRATGKNEEEMVNSLLSECIWGRVEGDSAAPVWKPFSLIQHPSIQKPAADCVSYSEFLEKVLYAPRKGDREYNDKQKKLSSEVKRLFTSEGQPGFPWAHDFAHLIEALTIPRTEEVFYKKGKVFIVPAFFHLLRHLLDLKWGFSLTIRTFGSDMLDVAEELNMFCTGRHPSFLGYRADGTAGSRDMRLEAKEFGTFYRDSDEPGVHLLLGSLEQPTSVQAGFLSGKTPISGFPDIWKFLASRDRRVYGIRDFHPFWKLHQESDSSGKLLVVDTSDRSVLPIFFDDNVERDRSHIVDVRTLTGEPIPFAESVDHYIVKAEPLHAITDPNYFIKLVELCCRNRTSATRSSSLAVLRKRPTSRSITDQSHAVL
jgi:hypothetical protein